MADPAAEREVAVEAVRLAADAAEEYLAQLDSAPASRAGDGSAATQAFAGSLPEDGDGALAALRELLDGSHEAAIQSSGPRMFHFVTGGVTPAALGADWIASLIDQNALGWTSSPLAARLEAGGGDWLQELFRPPPGGGGGLTAGGALAHFSPLA